LLAFLLYFLSYIFRALRWKILYPQADVKYLFLTTAINTALNNIVPARLGELSIFALLKKYARNTKELIKKFFIVRFYDLFTLLWLLAFSLSYLYGYSVLFLIFFSFFLGFISFLERKFRLSEYIKWSLAILSFLASFSKLIAVFLIVKTILPDFFRFCVGFIGGEISSVLPFHSLAGIGTYETSFSLAMKIFLNENFKEGFEIAFLSHTFLLLSSIIMLLMGFLIKFFRSIFVVFLSAFLLGNLYSCGKRISVKVPSSFFYKGAEKPFKGKIFIRNFQIPFYYKPKEDKIEFPLSFMFFVRYYNKTFCLKDYCESYPLPLWRILKHRFIIGKYQAFSEGENIEIKTQCGEKEQIFCRIYINKEGKPYSASICKDTCINVYYEDSKVKIPFYTDYMIWQIEKK
jgi:uncharacterized membrane protein YbhN (UPF0104 family)